MISIKYHAIFDYELVESDFPKWKYKSDKNITEVKNTKSKTRIDREKISEKKLIIAKKAARILSKIPTIKFVGVTGSLAMMNANENSDIDLMIITSLDSLWITRAFAYLFICLFGIQRRYPNDKIQKDRLCLNMWFDESDLVWSKSDRNIYTSHEIAQIMPLVNKDKAYENFLYQNKWILDYWPNSVRIRRIEDRKMNPDSSFLSYLLFLPERISFWLQHEYMKSKITREIVTKTRAVFHPQDWGKVVLTKLNSTRQ